jgi:hypothetical protein
MRALWIAVTIGMMGCTGENLPTTPSIPAVPPPPYTHPAFIRDTLWNEGIMGMTMVYESEGYTKPWSYREVTDTIEAIRKGWKAQRFEVRPGDCYGTDCQRTPVYERNEFAQIANENVEGDEYWYAWSFYVPANIPQAPWVFMGQFQQRSTYDSIWMFLKLSGQPFCAIFDWKAYNQFGCAVQSKNYPLISDQDFAGRWHDVLVHAKWTQQDNGFTKIYINGQLVVDYRGYTRTAGNTDVYFKYGIYRHASNQTSVVYYDEVRRGKTRQEVEIQ